MQTATKTSEYRVKSMDRDNIYYDIHERNSDSDKFNFSKCLLGYVAASENSQCSWCKSF
jgi:hypothetical protein